jgi:hypothetical protein
MFEVFQTGPKPKSSPMVLALRWGIPALFVVFGIVMLILAHGHLGGVQDNAAESDVFTSTTISHDSVLSTIGIGSIVVAVMLWLIGWMTRLSFASDGDRHKEDVDRAFFTEHGRWPTDEERDDWTSRQGHDEWSSDNG